MDGNSSQPNLVASAATQDFGQLSVGQQGQPINIDFTNVGTGLASALTASVAGADASSFVVDNDGCSTKTLAYTDKCTVTMHFNPANAGPLTGTLTVGDSAGDSVVVQLTGTGISAPEIALLPAMQDFGTGRRGGDLDAHHVHARQHRDGGRGDRDRSRSPEPTPSSSPRRWTGARARR